MIELHHIIESKRELLSRETYSRTPINYSEGMADDQKDRYIQYLAEQHQEDELTKKAMQQVLEDFMAKQQELEERMAGFMLEQAALKEELLEERKKRQSVEGKLQSVQEQLAYANQNRFGDRRQKVRKKRADGTTEKPAPDRKNEKDGFDGTEDTLRTDSVENHPSQEINVTSKKERDLSNRPDEYKKMGVAGEPLYHPSDLSKVPGRIIERKTVQVYSLRMLLVEERYEMVHYAEPGKKLHWGIFPLMGILKL